MFDGDCRLSFALPFLYQDQLLLKSLLRLFITFHRPSVSLCISHLHHSQRWEWSPKLSGLLGPTPPRQDTVTLYTQGWVKTEQLPPLWLSSAPTANFHMCNLSQELRFTTYFPLWESPLYNTLAYPASCGRCSQQKLILFLIFHRWKGNKSTWNRSQETATFGAEGEDTKEQRCDVPCCSL